jgi:broad specificity phosphatase PhoE
LLIVTHAGVMRAIITHVLGAPLHAMYRIQVANAARVRIGLEEERPATVVFSGNGR